MSINPITFGVPAYDPPFSVSTGDVDNLKLRSKETAPLSHESLDENFCNLANKINEILNTGITELTISSGKVAEGNLDLANYALASDLSTVQGDVSTLQTDLGTAQTDISTNATNISSNATDITALDTRVGTAESDITSLSTTVGTQGTSISANTTSIGGVDTRVTAIEADYLTSANFSYDANTGQLTITTTD